MKNTNTNTNRETIGNMSTAIVLANESVETFEPSVLFSTVLDSVVSFNALYGATENIADNLNKDIEVKGVIITTAKCHEDVNDDTSPEVVKPCISFITTDGRTISSISNGIWRSAKGLLELGITPTEETPIVLQFKETKTKRGIAHTITLVRGF